MCVERTRYWQDTKQLNEVRWVIVAQAMKQVEPFLVLYRSESDIQFLFQFYYIKHI